MSDALIKALQDEAREDAEIIASFRAENIHQQDEITRIRAENEKLREECQKLKDELAKWANYWRDKDVKALSADIHGLREALKPFAHLSDRIPSDYEDDRPDVTITLEKVPVKVIRAAAAALGKSNNED